jgi:type IV pilus assembly protein PilM
MLFNKSIGLDIGLTHIKAILLSRDKGVFVLNSFQSMPTSPKGMLSEAPLDEQEMAAVLKKVVDGLKTNTRRVNIALSDSKTYTKIIEMPVLSDKELSFAIYWEAERHIPVALSTITLVWSVLKRPSGSSKEQKMQVLMVGAPTVLVNKYQKVLQMAGLTLNSIETETLAVVRALVTRNLPPTIIVNIGATSTFLAIIREGILVLTYSIQTGGDAISRSIEADFGLTTSQSEEYKKTYGFSKKGVGKKIGKSTEPILASILLEVKKALAFYSQKYKDDSIIQQILLSGGTARLTGIDLFFAENLGIETVVAYPWKILGNQKVPEGILSSASDFTIALGLSMRDL